MFVVTVRFNTTESGYADFLKLVRRNAQASLDSEAGCQRFDVCSAPDRNEVFLYEFYDDAAAFEAHKETAHYRYFAAASAKVVTVKEVRTYGLEQAIANG
jgi:autoinducer 2-degrading protein